ncbi:flagellar assembly protein FliX [Paradevosia shaoguanensis]|uniref:Flagellar assembly protein FliX n=1 Tax=Paradevosia shaoguanensis TaxID=1335043 RepID=A0AA41UBT5_9HYPH|nr:flagellar assembly protein FliX [Paradevosia shaoguanensis]MCF1743192.1 flagellar assembly protein FliX [Paradevosia shaoguanensis]MCI0127675.1 flagellar assembly protein FliX [Paradevosia shaoguanensis]
MRIEGYSRTTGVGARAGVGRSGSAGAVFQPDMGEMPRVANARATSPTAGIDALLALQAIEDPVLKRRKTVRRGRALLDTLEAIKADLLLGRVGESRLNQLMALIGQAREQCDPELDALIDDIELRARVELAKLGKYPAF